MSLSRFVRAVVVAADSDSIATVARQMRDARVGCVVVTHEERPIGIVTDRDLVLRVLAEERNPSTTRVLDIVSYGPFVVKETDEIETAVRVMREHGVRRLPVVDDAGKLVGVVTNDDLVVLLGRELAALAEGIADDCDASDSR